MKILKYLFIFAAYLAVFAFAGGWILYSSHYQTEDEIRFYNELQSRLESRSNFFRVRDMTDFDWDEVRIVIQPDQNWSEERATSLIRSYGLKYSLLNDLTLPRFLKEYDALFIFSKNNEVVKILRLNKKEVTIDGHNYIFNRLGSGGPDTIVVKGQSPGAEHDGTISFCEPKNLQACSAQ